MAEGSSFLKIAAAVGCGFLGAVVLMFAACSALVVGVADQAAERAVAEEQAAASAPPRVQLLDWEWIREREWVDIRGQLKNVSDAPIEHLRVQVSFLDSSGSLVERSSFMTDPLVIGPGETATFSYPEEWDSRMSKARLSMTLDGRSLKYSE